MPLSVSELSNETLWLQAESGCHDACTERLTRNVMAVDKVEWLKAREVVKQISAKNREGIWIMTAPYKVGISTGIVGAIASFPMVFDFKTCMWFNKHYVTTEVPPAEDLQTWLEVGSWAWNWMEPPLGTVSFVLLALQFVRNQMMNMDLHPYTSWVRQYRANRLIAAFPQYDAGCLEDFAVSSRLNSWRG